MDAQHPTAEDVMQRVQQERFRPEEVSDLLGIPLPAVRRAVFAGELRATTLDHHILSIRRDALLAWLAARSGTPGA